MVCFILKIGTCHNFSFLKRPIGISWDQAEIPSPPPLNISYYQYAPPLMTHILDAALHGDVTVRKPHSLLTIPPPGGSPWEEWSLSDCQGQPGGAAPPKHLSRSQTRVGALQRVCAHHQELRPHLHWHQARVVSMLLSCWLLVAIASSQYCV